MRSRLLHIFLVPILLIGILLLSFVGVVKEAQALDAGRVALQCGVSVLVSGALQILSTAIGLGTAIKALKGALALIPVIGPFLSASIPEPNLDVAGTAERAIYGAFARCIARSIFDQTVAGILDTIRTKGRDGGASYVQNWRNFQTNAQYRGEDVFRAILANTQVCGYLRQDIDSLFRVSPRSRIPLTGQNIRVGDLDPFTLRAKCTLPSDFDIARYRQDFAGNGGWNTLLKISEPQNNPYGLYLLSQSEIEKQRALELASDLNEVGTPGYLSLRGETAAVSCLAFGPNGRCLFYNNIKTPAGYINASLEATINNELSWITNVHSLNDLVVDAITTRLVNRLMNLGASEADPVYKTDVLPRVSAIPTVPPLPSVSRPPMPTSGTPGGGGGGGSTTCQVIPSGNAGPFGAAIEQAATQIRNTMPGILDGGGWPYVVLDIDGYFAAMESVLESQGFVVTRDPNVPDQEINIYRTGASTSEQYAIRTSGGVTRAAHKATNCELPR